MSGWEYRVEKTEKNFQCLGEHCGYVEEKGVRRAVAKWDTHCLQELGAEGWELVSIVQSESSNHIRWVFKRPMSGA